MLLRDDQLELLNDIADAIDSGVRRIMVQAPTGYGKTVVATTLTKWFREQDKKVMFNVPALSLIDQTIAQFENAGLTDIGVIQAWNMRTDARMPIQVCSVQTLQRRVLPEGVSIVLIDEAHVWFKFYEKWLLDPAWKNVVFVGLSATPWTKCLGAWYEKLIIAGTTQEMIDEGILSPFRVFAPTHPDLTGVRTLGGDYHEGDLERAVNTRTLVADIVATWLLRGDNRPTLCFCVNRIHAKHVQEQFLASGVAAAYQDAYTKESERAEIKRAFAAGEIKVVCSVGTMIMGVDWDVRCIIWACPTKSEIKFVQGTGRGLRTADGKDYCLILDHSDNHLRLGFVTDIHHPELNKGTKQTSAKSERIALPKECPECSFLKPPKVRKCPSCGFETAPVVDVKVESGDLYEFKRKPKKTDLFQEESTWAGLQWWAQKRGYKIGWAIHKFKEIFGENAVPPVTRAHEPDAELASWIKHKQIAWAKSRRGQQVST